MKSLFKADKKDKEKLKKLRLIVLDTDGVIVPRGTEIIETENYVRMKLKHPPEEFYKKIKKLVKHYKILISSGRSMLTLRTMFSRLCIDGVYLQCENGSRVFSFLKSFSTANLSPRYFKKLFSVLQEIRKRKLKIRGTEPKETILTVHCTREIKEIYKIVRKFDKEKELYVIWNKEAFDIGSKEVMKGTGLKKFCKKLGIKKAEVLCIGDNKNDIPLLKEAGISVSTNPKIKADYYLFSRKKLPGIVLSEFLLHLHKSI